MATYTGPGLTRTEMPPVPEPKPSLGFINGTELEFVDISNEIEREYDFTGYSVTIKSPVRLNVSKHGHRIYDSFGTSHYIPTGWVHLSWTTKPGSPNFVK